MWIKSRVFEVVQFVFHIFFSLACVCRFEKVFRWIVVVLTNPKTNPLLCTTKHIANKMLSKDRKSLRVTFVATRFLRFGFSFNACFYFMLLLFLFFSSLVCSRSELLCTCFSLNCLLVVWSPETYGTERFYRLLWETSNGKAKSSN